MTRYIVFWGMIDFVAVSPALGAKRSRAEHAGTLGCLTSARAAVTG
jgi:hypothetical protein